MKLITIRKAIVYIAVIMLPVSCSKAHYIPNIGNTWKNTASAVPDYFYFNAEQAGAYASDFLGMEDINYSASYQFKGSYENHNIHFTFTTGPNSGITYSGKITGEGLSSVMTLNTSGGQLVLTQ